MRRPNLLVVISLVLASTIIHADPSDKPTAVTAADCVNCYVPRGDCVACLGWTYGGVLCRTPKCYVCRLSGRCGRRPGFENFHTGLTPDISDDAIRQVAQTHPRFAVAIAEQDTAGWADGLFEFRIKAVPLQSSDIEYWLADQNDPAVEQWHKNKAIESMPIEAAADYDMAVKRSGSNIVIYLQALEVAPGDPPYTRMTLTLAQNGNQWAAVNLRFE